MLEEKLRRRSEKWCLRPLDALAENMVGFLAFTWQTAIISNFNSRESNGLF